MNFTLLFGGISYEHEISIVTAITLKKIFEKENKKLNFIFLDGNREFYLILGEKMKSTTFSSGDYKKEKKLFLGSEGFSYKSFLGSTNVETGTVINLVHGGDGEDGKLASILDFYKIDYIGPRTEACVVSFNKYLTKGFAKEARVNVLDYILIKKEDAIGFDYPFILKPLRLGSSIGIAIIENGDEITYGKDVAFEYDDEALVEPFIKDIKEYNLAGCRVGEEFIFSVVEEPKKEGHLDFDKKYLDFARSSSVSEAEISTELKTQMEEAFKKIYDPLFEGSLIRCDFFYHDEKLYLNEINPIPGSMANYLFDNFVDIITKLAVSLPKTSLPQVSYGYIHQVQSAKGKA